MMPQSHLGGGLAPAATLESQIGELTKKIAELEKTVADLKKEKPKN